MFMPHVNKQARAFVDDTLQARDDCGRLWIGEGLKVKEFENALKARFGFKHCVALNSGTAGLELALALAGVGPGDEVITPAYTCTATNMPILRAGAKCIFADIQYLTGNIDWMDVNHRVTERTRAIMVVHWAGYPCDMESITFLAKRLGIPVIQDGAHSLGATYQGQPIGVTSEYYMCSFQAIKQLTTGDGGMLAMLDENKYNEARRRRWFAIDRDNRVLRLDGYAYWDQAEIGYKMHMNDIAAAIGLGNMEDIDWILNRRAEIAARYRVELAKAPGVKLFNSEPDRTSGNWLFTMHVENRTGFCLMMRAAGIEVSVVHIRNDAHSVFGGRRPDLPMTDLYERTNISIPLHQGMTDSDVGRVIQAIQGGW
jgi:perosamine synthetase